MSRRGHTVNNFGKMLTARTVAPLSNLAQVSELWPKPVPTVAHAPAGNEVAGRRRPFRKKEFETISQKAARHNAAALEDEFRLGPHQEGTQLNHPFRSRQADASTPCLAQGLHEVTIR